jgi:hypothetical protein
MLRLIVPALLTLSLLIGPSARAQTDTEPARREVARALIKAMDELTGPERSIKATSGAMRQGLQQQMAADHRLSPAQRQRAVDVMSEELTAAVTEMMREVMPTVYAGMEMLYVQRFSLAELQELLRFYTSSLGRKSVNVMLDDMPQLMQPMMNSMQAQAPQLHKRMEAATDRLRAEGIELKPAKP